MTRKTLISHAWNPHKHRKAGLITDGESLTSAFFKWGSEIRTYDDGFGPLWLYQNEGGMWVVRAQTFEDTLECVYDEMPTVPQEELYEAYGFDTDEEFQAAVTKAEESGDFPELAEGYSHQANASGTGIVFPGYSEHLSELTHADIERLEISLIIEGEENDA